MLRALAMPAAVLEAEARRLREALRQALDDGTAAPAAQVELLAGGSQVGGGSVPGQDLPTTLVTVKPRALSAGALEERLRANDPPILCRVQQELVCLDPRTLLPGDAEVVVEAVARVLGRGAAGGAPSP